MALKKNWKFQITGGIEVTVQDAYVRVVNIHGDKFAMTATLNVCKDPSSTEAIAVHVGTFEPVLNEKNFIAQAYDHFKTWPEFADAVDC